MLLRVNAAELLRTARWHAALSQAEVAARAGTSQQTVARYETGAVSPMVPTLERLLAACGFHLHAFLDPEPGLEDEPTRRLLAAEPILRLAEDDRDAVLDLARALRQHDVAYLLAGKLGARLHGAVVRVWDLDLWFAEDVRLPTLQAALDAAGVVDAWGDPVTELELNPRRATSVVCRRRDVRLEPVEFFRNKVERAFPVLLDTIPALLATPDDLALPWHPRDRDHLALQRARRLREAAAAGNGRRPA